MIETKTPLAKKTKFTKLKSTTKKPQLIKKEKRGVVCIEELQIPVWGRNSLEEVEAFLISRFKDIHDGKVNARKVWGVKEINEVKHLYVLHFFKLGVGMVEIYHHLEEMFNIGYTTAKRMCKEALEYLVEGADDLKNYYREVQIARAEKLMNIAIARGDLKTALAANDQLNKIGGCYTEKVEQITKHEYVFEFGE